MAIFFGDLGGDGDLIGFSGRLLKEREKQIPRYTRMWAVFVLCGRNDSLELCGRNMTAWSLPLEMTCRDREISFFQILADIK